MAITLSIRDQVERAIESHVPYSSDLLMYMVQVIHVDDA